MFIYSGCILIEGMGTEADYEFEHEDELNGMEQLEYLLNSGLLQIIDNEPVWEDDEEEEDDE